MRLLFWQCMPVRFIPFSCFLTSVIYTGLSEERLSIPSRRARRYLSDQASKAPLGFVMLYSAFRHALRLVITIEYSLSIRTDDPGWAGGIMNFRRRDIFLKIESLPSYSPLAPVACARHFGRDCMFNAGHESGRIPAQEILASTADGLVYREYLDAHYTIPNKAKLIEADVNEPPWDRRIPGCLLYAKPGERLYIHVWNADTSDCHSFHIHGLRYGIESDGAWPLGVAARDGRRSDEILPGQKWTYVYDVTPDMVGAWGFHDHAHDVARNINLGLFGGLIVRDPAAPCADHEVPVFIHQFAGSSSVAFQSKRLAHGDLFNFVFADAEDCSLLLCDSWSHDEWNNPGHGGRTGQRKRQRPG